MNEPPSADQMFWKSFEELTRDPAVLERLRDEFPSGMFDPVAPHPRASADAGQRISGQEEPALDDAAGRVHAVEYDTPSSGETGSADANAMPTDGTALPTGEAALPTGEAALHTGGAALPTGEAALHTGGAALHTGEAAADMQGAGGDAQGAEEGEEWGTMNGDVEGGMTRRTFLALTAASMALVAAGCRRPEEKIVPYVRTPEYETPGVAVHFATACMQGNVAAGLLVRTREGRPVKIEGNDRDPVSAGRSTARMQALLLSLYDPDRTLRPTVNNGDSTPANAIMRMARAITDETARGRQVWIMIDEHASPSRTALLDELMHTIPLCHVVTWPAITAGAAAEANLRVRGMDAEPVADLARADVVLGVDADFLGTDPAALWHIRRFASRRTPTRERPEMSRFHAVECTMSTTSLSADTRTIVHPSELRSFLGALLAELATVHARPVDPVLLTAVQGMPDPTGRVARIAADLAAVPSVVMMGRHLTEDLHALGIAINHAIGADATTGALGAALVLPHSGARRAEMSAFRTAVRDHLVGVLIMADVNPAYAYPSGTFPTLISEIPWRFALSTYADETSKLCQIFLPVAHPLESWDDARMIDGSLAVVQPMIAPLNEDEPSLGDALLRLGQALRPDFRPGVASWHDYVQERWQREVHPARGGEFRTFWEEVLREGTLRPAAAASAEKTRRARTTVHAEETAPGSRALHAKEMAPGSRALHAKEMAPGSRALHAKGAALGFDADAAARMIREATVPQRRLTAAILPSHALYDGRDANLGWLQELPDPVTKIVWGNAAIMSRATAAQLGVARDDLVRVHTRGGAIELPVFIQPGMADDVVAVHTGYGRSEGGRVLDGVGANAFRLVPEGRDSIGHIPCAIEKTGRTERIATTQNHFSLAGADTYGIDRSDIVKAGTLAEFRTHPERIVADHIPVEGAERQDDRPVSIVPPHDYSKGHRWGMVIDTTACVGCNACVTACQAENNIPVVGKDQVMRGRHMAWIRIDLYHRGDADHPETLLQPMLCQHCENAPCENVCPVAATTHSPEGLNEMAYNRCVGTRYCSNNCPYKVRRFNFLDWHAGERDPMALAYNPDVTVRARGVMEKCTFCIQRINDAKFHARNEGRTLVRDGDILTACQQACPAAAIVFGNTNDPSSRVSQLRTSARGYHVLRELNVLPSITYLAKIRNDGREA